MESQKYEEALRCFEEALKQNPKEDEYWNNKGQALFSLERHEEAIKCFEEALKLNPYDEEYWFNKANALFQQEKYVDALKCYNEALKFNPSNEEYWYNKGYTLYQQGKFEEAMQCYNEALKFNPKYVDAWNGRGDIFDEQEKYEEALKCFNESIKLDPKCADAWNGRGNTFSEQGKYEDALKCFDEALRLNPKEEEYWNDKGFMLYKQQKYEEALKCYNEALKLNSKYVDALNGRGNTLFEQGKYDDAIKCYNLAIKHHPNDADPWNFKGSTLNQKGEFDEAIQCCDRAIQLKPSYPNPWQHKGFALLQKGNIEGALQCLDEALKLKPKFPSAWNAKGLALERKADYDNAMKCFEEALKWKPNHKEAKQNKERMAETLAMEVNVRKMTWAIQRLQELRIQRKKLKDNLALAYEGLLPPTIQKTLAELEKFAQQPQQQLVIRESPQVKAALDAQEKLRKLQEAIRGLQSQVTLEQQPNLLKERDQQRKAFIDRAKELVAWLEGIDLQQLRAKAIQNAEDFEIFLLDEDAQSSESATASLEETVNEGKLRSDIGALLQKWKDWKKKVEPYLDKLRSNTEELAKRVVSELNAISVFFAPSDDTEGKSSASPKLGEEFLRLQEAINQELQKPLLLNQFQQQLPRSELNKALAGIARLQRVFEREADFGAHLLRDMKERIQAEEPWLGAVRPEKQLQELYQMLATKEGNTVQRKEELLASVGKLAFEFFPELIVQYPQLNLRAYLDTDGLESHLRAYADYTEVTPVRSASPRFSVFTAKWNSAPCVLKSVELREMEKDSKILRHEAKLFSRLSHPNLVELQAFFFEDDKKKGTRVAYLHFPLQSALHLLDWTAQKQPTEAQLRAVLKGVVRGVEYLHEGGVIYGDLRPQNILMTNDEPKLAEFDLARDAEARKAALSKSSVPTVPDYVAPEVFSQATVFRASDIYALGLIVYELHFPAIKRPHVSVHLNDKKPLEVPPHSNEHLRELIKRSLALNPQERLTARKMLSHPFFMAPSSEDDAQVFRDLQKTKEQQSTFSRQEEELFTRYQQMTTQINQLRAKKMELEQTLVQFNRLHDEQRLTAERQQVTTQLDSLEKERAQIFQTRKQTLLLHEAQLHEATLTFEKKGAFNQPPLSWHLPALIWQNSAGNQLNRVDVTAELLTKIQGIVTNTCIPAFIGSFKDLQTPKHKGFQVMKIERIENRSLWRSYAHQRRVIAEELIKPTPSALPIVKIATYESWMKDDLGLQPVINEAYLFHETSQPLIYTTISKGVQCRLSHLSDGLLGPGIVFYENSSRADENISADENGLCYMFLTRVCLGATHITEKPLGGFKRLPAIPGTNDTKFFDSILGESQRTGSSNSFLQRYREFVVFDSRQTYPEFLITFKRVF